MTDSRSAKRKISIFAKRASVSLSESAITGLHYARVKLGSQGLEVSKQGYGCMGVTGVYNDVVSKDFAIYLIKHYFTKGIMFFDTSDVYGPRINEVLVKKALKDLPRDQI